MKKIKKILVPTDLSEFSPVAMDYARPLAAQYQAQIYMIHVITDEPPIACSININLENHTRTTSNSSNPEIEQFFTEQIKQDKNVVCIIRRGEASKEILNFAEEEQIDLIVLSTHGRTGLSYVIMGSVAEKVVRHSTVPVLIIKTRDTRQGELLKQEEVQEQLHVNPSSCHL